MDHWDQFPQVRWYFRRLDSLQLFHADLSCWCSRTTQTYKWNGSNHLAGRFDGAAQVASTISVTVGVCKTAIAAFITTVSETICIEGRKAVVQLVP